MRPRETILPSSLLLAMLCSTILVAPAFGQPGEATSPVQSQGSQGNWPQWRGPLGTGLGPQGDPPIHWSEEKNIRFKVALPGHGLASPVVWDETIFLLATEAADEAAYAASQQAAAEKMERREWPPSVEPVAQRFLVLAAGRIYIFDRAGSAVVLAAGDRFEVLAENQLGEGVDASPAVVGDQLLVRGRRHLYAIAHPTEPEASPQAIRETRDTDPAAKSAID